MNPKSHHINTVQDMANCVTLENIDSFLSDLKGILLSTMMLNELAESEGLINQVIIPSFEWIDDGVNEVKIDIAEITTISSVPKSSEDIFLQTAKLNMVNFNLEDFKKSHPKLYKSIIDAIEIKSHETK